MSLPTSRLALVLAALMGAVPPAARAAEADPDAASVERVRKALDQTISVKIERRPLAAALAALGDAAKVPVVLDASRQPRPLQRYADRADLVDLDLKGVTARRALHDVLTPYNLCFVIINDRVVVASEEVAADLQLRQPLRVDADGTPLADVLRRIGRGRAVNLVLDPRVEKEASARVSLRVEDAPLETAVRLLAAEAGLEAVRVGGVLFVTGREGARETRGEADATRRRRVDGHADRKITFK